MLKIGMIGAGTIAQIHLDAYEKCKDVKVAAIADLNETLAKEQAQKYQIGNVYRDYHEMLKAEEIDAVNVATPLFTHAQIVQDALRAGKHVLCEKPPCLTAREAEECIRVAEECGKLLMWGFVCRFRKEIRFLKEYVDAGKMGKIYYAEASRIMRCQKSSGWFLDKSKAGGGALFDGAIHELDELLYLMGYPKAKVVSGFTTDCNKELPEKMKSASPGWKSADTGHYERTIESMASGHILFENGACLYVKAAYSLYSVSEGTYIEMSGERAGARMEGEKLSLLSNCNDYFLESRPVLKERADLFAEEMQHFIDCCLHKAECICEAWQGVELIRIVEAIYRSAESGMPVIL